MIAEYVEAKYVGPTDGMICLFLKLVLKISDDTRCRECDRKLEDFDRKCGQSRSGYAFILRIKSYLSCLLVM